MIIFRFFIILLTSTGLARVHATDLHLIVGLPLQLDMGATSASWERGWQILPGAQIAVESINDRPDILPGHRLHITAVDIGSCKAQNNDFLLQIINATYYQNNVSTFIGAVGIFCPTEVLMFANEDGDSCVQEKLMKENLKMITGLTNSHGGSNHNPSLKMITTFLEFLDALEWKNLAVITETRSTYYFSYFTERLLRQSMVHNRNVSFSVYTYTSSIRLSCLNLPRISLVSISEPSIAELICNAYIENMTWPEHIWIIHTHRFEAIVNSNAPCDLGLALENVFFLIEKAPVTYFTNKSVYNEKYLSKLPSNQKIGTNVYSIILHNLVWSLALQVAVTNTTLTGEFQPGIGMRVPTTRQPIVLITQIRNLTEATVATYSDKLSFSDPSFVTNAPSDKLLTVVEGGSAIYTAVFLTEIVAGFLFVTSMLIGYSCFRNTLEVKSTSFSLSMLVFLGFYLVLVYLSILLYFHQPLATSSETLNGLCISLNWFSGLGISSALILGTNLVKLLRVYYIFSKSASTRLSKRCTDSYLALYVLLVISPLVLIHVTWNVVDPYLGVFKISTELDVIRIEKQCNSNYSFLWYGLLIVYMTIIFVSLLVVAFKSRKIHNKHFKDTKKVTILVCYYFLDIVLALTLWRIIYTRVNAYFAAIILHIGHITALLVFQGSLFAPKVIPPLAQRIKDIM